MLPKEFSATVPPFPKKTGRLKNAPPFYLCFFRAFFLLARLSKSAKKHSQFYKSVDSSIPAQSLTPRLFPRTDTVCKIPVDMTCFFSASALLTASSIRSEKRFFASETRSQKEIISQRTGNCIDFSEVNFSFAQQKVHADDPFQIHALI